MQQACSEDSSIPPGLLGCWSCTSPLPAFLHQNTRPRVEGGGTCGWLWKPLGQGLSVCPAAGQLRGWVTFLQDYCQSAQPYVNSWGKCRWPGRNWWDPGQLQGRGAGIGVGFGVNRYYRGKLSVDGLFIHCLRVSQFVSLLMALPFFCVLIQEGILLSETKKKVVSNWL